MRNFDLTFMTCGGCKTVYYCSRKCQKEAWSDHHKLECKALITAKEQNCISDAGRPLVLSQRFRFMLRLLLQHRTGRITEEQLAEMLMLPKTSIYFGRDSRFRSRNGRSCSHAANSHENCSINKQNHPPDGHRMFMLDSRDNKYRELTIADASE